MFGTIHEYIVRYQLPIVFIGSHHIGDDTLSSGFCGKCTYHIVGFVTGDFQNRNTVGADDIFYNRYGETDGFGSFFPLRFILFISLVAECWS